MWQRAPQNFSPAASAFQNLQRWLVDATKHENSSHEKQLPFSRDMQTSSLDIYFEEGSRENMPKSQGFRKKLTKLTSDDICSIQVHTSPCVVKQPRRSSSLTPPTDRWHSCCGPRTPIVECSSPAWPVERRDGSRDGGWCPSCEALPLPFFTNVLKKGVFFANAFRVCLHKSTVRGFWEKV